VLYVLSRLLVCLTEHTARGIQIRWLPIMRAVSKRLAVVRALLLWQLCSCLLMALLALFFGVTASYSVLLGGLICLLPNCYFAYRAFQYEGARAAREIVKSFYRGEAGKLVLTALLFSAVFIGVKPLHPLALMCGYCVVLSLGWFVPLLHGKLSSKAATS